MKRKRGPKGPEKQCCDDDPVEVREADSVSYHFPIEIVVEKATERDGAPQISEAEQVARILEWG